MTDWHSYLWVIFCPKKNQNYEKLKKIAGDIIILHLCTKTTIIWGMVPEIRSETEFFVILGYFLTFNPLKIWKITIFQKWKKHLEMSSFYTCATKIRIIWCMLPKIRSVTGIILCHFGPFFALLPHYWSQKLKFGKISKTLEILSFHMCNINEDHIMHGSWDIRHNKVFYHSRSILSIWAFCQSEVLQTDWNLVRM